MAVQTEKPEQIALVSTSDTSTPMPNRTTSDARAQPALAGHPVTPAVMASAVIAALASTANSEERPPLNEHNAGTALRPAALDVAPTERRPRTAALNQRRLRAAAGQRGAPDSNTVEQVSLAVATRDAPVQVQVEATPMTCPAKGRCVPRVGEPDDLVDADARAHAIAEKVAKVLPLIYWDWDRRGQICGSSRVLFRLNGEGYVEKLTVAERMGDPVIARESDNALLLASPYDYLDGWIELKLTFRG